MFRASSAFRCVLGLYLLALAAPGHALTQVCVHDAQELRDALYNASLSSDTPILITIRKGTYKAADATGSFSLMQTRNNQSIGISGGWDGDNGDCTRQTRGATGTTLVGTAARRALDIATSDYNGRTGNQLFVSDLGLTNPVGTGSGTCLLAQVKPGNRMVADRLYFDQCVSTSGQSATLVAFDNTGGQLSVSNVVVRRGQGIHQGGMGVGTSNGGTTTLSQLSITGNTAAIDQGYIWSSGLLLYSADASSRIDLSNSVVWGNASDVDTKDISVSGPNVYFTRVHYGAIKGDAPAANIGATLGDPGFVATGDPRLKPNSLLINTGSDNAPGSGGDYDIDGRARVIGAHIDVGAYEWSDAIFAHGFEQ